MKIIVKNSNLVFEKKVTRNYIDGKYLSADNNIGTDDTCIITSDFIPVDVNSDLLWRFGSGTRLDTRSICFYDTNKEYVTYWSMARTSSSTATSRTLRSTDIKQYAANAKYVKATFFKHSDVGLYQNEIAIFEPEPKIVE